jgi:hypothetical protein
VLLEDRVSQIPLSTDGKVGVFDVHQAWVELDPQRPALDVEEKMRKALGGETLDWEAHIEPQDFFKKLFKSCMVMRYNQWDPHATPYVATTRDQKRDEQLESAAAETAGAALVSEAPVKKGASVKKEARPTAVKSKEPGKSSAKVPR